MLNYSAMEGVEVLFEIEKTLFLLVKLMNLKEKCTERNVLIYTFAINIPE